MGYSIDGSRDMPEKPAASAAAWLQMLQDMHYAPATPKTKLLNPSPLVTLMRAIYFGDDVGALLSSRPDLYPDTLLVGRATPLIFAIVMDRADAVAALAAHPLVNLNARTVDGWTPLHVAAHFGRQEMIPVLLRHKADAFAKNKAGQTPLDLCDDDGCAGLLQKKTNASLPQPPVAMAGKKKEGQGSLNYQLVSSLVHGDDPETIARLIDLGADVFALRPKDIDGNYTGAAQKIWQWAVLHRREKALKEILFRHPSLMEYPSDATDFLDLCGYGVLRKPDLWKEVRQRKEAHEKINAASADQTKLIGYKRQQSAKPMTQSQLDHALLETLQHGDYPYTVSYLMRRGANPGAKSDAPTHLMNIGHDRRMAGRIWQWALEEKRQKSFFEICLWGGNWHKNKNMELLHQDVDAMMQRHKMLSLGPLTSEKRKGELRQQEMELRRWTQRGLNMAQYRTEYMTKNVSEEELHHIFALTVADRLIPEMMASYAELCASRPALFGEKKHKPANVRVLSNAFLHALQHEEYGFAHAMAEKGIEPFDPSPGIRDFFNRNASADARLFLEKTRFYHPPRIIPHRDFI